MSVRLGGGPQADVQRSLLRAIELLHTDTPDSTEQILILLRKARSEHAVLRPGAAPAISGVSSGASGSNLGGLQVSCSKP